jgi:hypothetical protein
VMTPETVTQALRHLSEADPVLARVIAQAGPPTRLIEVAAHPVPTVHKGQEVSWQRAPCGFSLARLLVAASHDGVEFS